MPTKTVNVQVSGLAQQPNPLSGVPLGSLQQADNVVMRRPGMLEPAPRLDVQLLNDIPDDNQQVLKSFGDALDTFVCNIILGDGDVGAPTASGLQVQNTHFPSTEDYFTGVRDSDATSAANLRRLNFFPGTSFQTFSRDRRIFTGTGTPYTLTSNTTDSALELRIAGMQQPGGILAIDWGSAPQSEVIVAPIDKQCYYKATFLRRYSNYDIESSPTAPFLYVNDSGSDQYAVRVRVRSNDETTPASAGDLCVLYRTPFSDIDVDPGDNFQECMRYTLDSSDVSDGGITMYDLCPDANLAGAELYTNETQQGAKQANYPPPDSRCIATYNDTTFYASNQDWPAVSFGIQDFGNIAGGAAIGRYGVSISVTHGATSIVYPGDVGPGSVANLRPGMVVSYTVTSIADTAFGYVTSVVFAAGNTTVTFDGSYGLAGTVTPTTGAHFIYTSDSIRFEVLEYDGSTSNYLFWYQDPDPWTIPAWISGTNSQIRAIVVSTMSVPEPPSVNLSFVTSQVGRFQKYTVYLSRGFGYTQLDHVTTSGDSQTGIKASTQSMSQSLCFFSKTSQPESVPPLNSFSIGHGVIQRLISDQNSLYAMCTDGLYRITGGGNDWTVVQVSRTHMIVHPDAACVCNGIVFAWFTQGVCAVTESGPQNISDSAIGPTLQPIATDVLFNFQDNWGIFMASDDYQREIYLSVYPTNDGSTVIQPYTTYAYSLTTNSWTTRSSLAPVSAAYVPAQTRLYWSNNVLDLPRLSWEDGANTGYEYPVVVFNEFTAGAPGVLKQWIDLNLLAENAYIFDETDGDNFHPVVLQFLFGEDDEAPYSFSGVNFMFFTETGVLDDAEGAGYPYLCRTPAYFSRAHNWVPKRLSVKDTLTAGFSVWSTPYETDGGTFYKSLYFQLLGITLRYRVASDTFQI